MKMTKVLMAATALIAMAGPASAQTWSTQTYGQDFAAWWQLNANAAVFCKLNAGTGNIQGTNNATAVIGANGQGGTVAEGDGTMTLNIQEPATNTIRNASAFISFPFSQCNTKWTATGNSLNGGLKNSSQTTTDTDFLAVVPYNVGINFDTVVGGGPVAAGNFPLNAANKQAQAGTFVFNVDVPANNNKLLLAGAYTDFLKVTLAPTP